MKPIRQGMGEGFDRDASAWPGVAPSFSNRKNARMG